MLKIGEAEKKSIKIEWDAAVSRLKNSRVDLSKILLLPVSVEYKKER